MTSYARELNEAITPRVLLMPKKIRRLMLAQMTRNGVHDLLQIDPNMSSRGRSYRGRPMMPVMLRVPNQTVYLHEVVHQIGGNEVDAEAFECIYGRWPTAPDPVYDRKHFSRAWKDGFYHGTFVHVDTQGFVFLNATKEPLGQMALPN